MAEGSSAFGRKTISERYAVILIMVLESLLVFLLIFERVSILFTNDLNCNNFKRFIIDIY